MNNHIIATFIAGSVLLTMFAFLLIFLILHQKKRQEAHLMEKQKLVIAHQNSRMEEQEKLMSQISKEVHDNIGQIANLIHMNLLEIRSFIPEGEDRELVLSTCRLADHMRNDARSISQSLNSDFIKIKGLVNSVKSEISLISNTKKITAEMNVEGDVFHFQAKQELLLFRIIQEALHNTLKHANASVVNVNLVYAGSNLKVIISDNGIGMDVGMFTELSGIGFLNMHQRTRFLDGTLSVNSYPGKGCSIVLDIPKKEPEAEQFL